MRISDWSSDVCSSDLVMARLAVVHGAGGRVGGAERRVGAARAHGAPQQAQAHSLTGVQIKARPLGVLYGAPFLGHFRRDGIAELDRKSVVWGKRVSVRLYLGGRRLSQKNKKCS